MGADMAVWKLPPSDAYVILNGRMVLKANDEFQDIPIPNTPDKQAEIDSVWAAYDRAGQPFIYYHSISGDEKSG